MTTQEKIDQLAQRIATDALKEEVSLADRVDALKQLTAYYAASLKDKNRQSDEEPDEATMGSIQDRLKLVEGGSDAGTQVRNRQGR